MKKISIIVAMAIAAVHPASAIWDGQLGIGYNQVNLSDNGGSSKVPDQNYKGATLNASTHLNFSIPGVLSLGVGPYVVYAPDMAYTYGSSGSGVTVSNTQFSVGGELQAKVIAVPIVSPYVKLGYGIETLKSTGTANAITVEVYKFSGSGLRVLAGIEIPIVGPLAVFAEGGFTSMTYDLNYISVSQPNYKTKGAAFLINAGVSFAL